MEFSKLRIGERCEAFEVERSAELRGATLEMLRQGRHSVLLVTRELDAPVLDDAEVCAAVRDLVTGSRHARVRALVQDPLPAVRAGHRLVHLARRLSSFIEIRLQSQEHMRYNAAFMVVDAAACIHRRHAGRFEAEVSFDGARRARALEREFEDMWAVSRADTNLRQLAL